MEMIAIVAAMSKELEELRLAFSTTRSIPMPAGVSCELVKLEGITLAIVESGIGKANAAIATALTAELLKPDCIINIGSIGSLDPSVKPRELILADTVAYHDVDITSFGYAHGQIPNMPPNYTSSPLILEILNQTAEALNLTFHRGLCLTGDQFITQKATTDALKQQFPSALGVDMESAAIAQAAFLFAIPFACVRGVSDEAQEDSAEVFYQHLETAAARVAKVIIHSIPELTALGQAPST